MDHNREVMRALNFDMSRYEMNITHGIAPPEFDSRPFEEQAGDTKTLFWMIEAKEAKARMGAFMIALSNLSDADIKKVWDETPTQGDPSGHKFAIAFARNVLKKVESYTHG